MTKFLPSVIVLYTLPIFGQVEIINRDINDISLNIFYKGVDNHIRLKAGDNTSSYKVSVMGAGSSILNLDNSEYLVRVHGNETCKVIISRNNKTVLVKNYKVDVIGNPTATLNGVRDTTVSKNKILLNPFLVVLIPDCYYRHHTWVVSFHATFIHQGDSIVTYAAGHSFSAEQVKLTKRLDIGDKILFNEVRAGGPDTRISKLHSFWINVE